MSFLLPWLIPAWWRDLKAKDPATLLFGGWIILLLLFFSLSEGKRSVYIFPEFLLQWDAPAVHFGYRRRDDNGESRDAAAWLSADTNHRLLLSGEMMVPCFESTRLTDLGWAHRQQWYLARPSSVLPGCTPAAGKND
ncbi:MAG: hypothetical protein O7E57_02750 [Gammaproteobacteria bacterium]|nr:hypothetical protein [Gammaproteobacteria bacterium]